MNDCFQFLRFSLDSLVKTEAVTRSVLYKKVFLEISQNSQENPVSVSLF